MGKYFDIAVNLIGGNLENQANEVIQDALAVGVSPLLIIGSHLEESECAMEFAHDYLDLVYTTAGVHPHHASSWNEASAARLKSLCQSHVVKAVGECGLDYNRNYSPQDKQREAFIAQLEIAAENQLPVLMHERDAHKDFISILKAYRSKLPKMLLHCFTGNQQQLEAYIELDLYIGITGWVCDERRGQELARIVPLIPDNRIMIETDSPYLLPRSMRPKPKSSKNLPKYLPYIAGYIANLRGQNPQKFAEICYQNSLRYFNLND